MKKYLEFDFNENDINKLAGNETFAELIRYTLNNFLWGKSIKVREIHTTANVNSMNVLPLVIADGNYGMQRGL